MGQSNHIPAPLISQNRRLIGSDQVIKKLIELSAGYVYDLFGPEKSFFKIIRNLLHKNRSV